MPKVFTIETIEKFPLSLAPLALADESKVNAQDAYTAVLLYPGIYSCYEFQRAMVERVGGKCLNAASAYDPGGLGDLGAINLDVQTFEKHTGKDFSKMCKNFVHGTVFDIPFQEEHFDCVVLGEFLEHATPEKAVAAMMECRRVLKPGGFLVLTFPLDGRSREEQLDGQENPPWEYCDGITVHHSRWWGNAEIRDLKIKTRFVEVGRAALVYILTAPLGGWGLLLQKP